MTEFDYSDEYADNDIIDFVQVDTSEHKKQDKYQKETEKAKQPDEKTILKQLKKKTTAEIQQEKERQQYVRQEE